MLWKDVTRVILTVFSLCMRLKSNRGFFIFFLTLTCARHTHLHVTGFWYYLEFVAFSCHVTSGFWEAPILECWIPLYLVAAQWRTYPHCQHHAWLKLGSATEWRQGPEDEPKRKYCLHSSTDILCSCTMFQQRAHVSTATLHEYCSK